MTAKQLWIIAGLMIVFVSALAQKSDYVGQESREIKALSSEDIQGFLEGRGMGLAKAAELNGYPGPMHVLQMKEALSISKAQEIKLTAIFDKMKRETKSLGRELVSAEANLEKEFRSNRANPTRVEDLTSMIGAIHARIRASHLNAHIATKPLMTTAQLKKYEHFRGYK